MRLPAYCSFAPGSAWLHSGIGGPITICAFRKHWEWALPILEPEYRLSSHFVFKSRIRGCCLWLGQTSTPVHRELWWSQSRQSFRSIPRHQSLLCRISLHHVYSFYVIWIWNQSYHLCLILRQANSWKVLFVKLVGTEIPISLARSKMNQHLKSRIPWSCCDSINTRCSDILWTRGFVVVYFDQGILSFGGLDSMWIATGCWWYRRNNCSNTLDLSPSVHFEFGV